MYKQKRTFTHEERKNYFEGMTAAREDYAWCKGNKAKINDCIATRQRMRKLCQDRKDKNGVSFQNGYLNYFFKKVKKT